MATGTEVRELVKAKYGAAARKAAEGEKDAGCCSSSGCGCASTWDAPQQLASPCHAARAARAHLIQAWLDPCRTEAPRLTGRFAHTKKRSNASTTACGASSAG